MPRAPKKSEPKKRPLEDIAVELGEVYFIEKDAKVELTRYRGEFFDGATESFAQEELARKTVEVPEAVVDSDAYVARYYPGWRVVSKPEAPEQREYIIEEDPAWLKKEVVVPVDDHTGYVVTRTIRSGSQLLDDDRLRAENPVLWLTITRPRNFELLSGLVGSILAPLVDFDEMLVLGEIDGWAVENDWPRDPIPPDELDEETIEEIKPYFFEGPKTAALNVRLAKPEELP